uniref:Glutathione S-transferase omega n=1 Tax=Pyxicephalus adspersus TaxID=30357 RepID=A0AAV2ZFB7_PYXAD|nr:TPA: hypothetical protein GDO54_004348 [Pyxicephalus adspersus]
MTGSERSFAKGMYAMHEVVNINLKNKPDWFFEKSPLGLVPSIETSDGKIIYESPIVCEYLDEAFPGTKLIPSDPYAKAEQKMLLETFSALPPIFYKILFAKKDDNVTEFKAQFFEKFKKLEEALTKKNTPYFGGESVSYVDYMVWPWFERFTVFEVTEVFEKTPLVKAWLDRMMQDPAVKATFSKPDVLVGFFKLYSKDSVDAVDFGLD